MNKKQMLYAHALKSALETKFDPLATTHARQSQALQIFNDAGFDPADYDYWLGNFNQTAQTMMANANQKLLSEILALQKEQQAKAAAAQPAGK